MQTVNKIDGINAFFEHMAIPKSCELNKPIYKKMFLDNGALDVTDKACIKDDIDKVRWLYTLKPSTINIAPYVDNEREYPEVAVLHVELSNPKRIKRIANFINRSIPYPLVLIFTCIIEGKDTLAISLADKRINQADKEKWVIEDSINTDWIELNGQTEIQSEFLNSLTINSLPFKNFKEFYHALLNRVIANNCASHSGKFSLDNPDEAENGIGRLSKLRELEKLDIKKAEIANKLKKEKQMGKQVELNTQVKQINDRIALIKGSL